MNFHGMFVPVGKMAGIGSSKQNIGFVDMLCEGPIYGLVDGKNSVFVDNIPFENSSAVGSFTKSNATALATLTTTGDTTKTYTVSGIELRDVDVGKLAIIEVASVTLSTMGQAMNVGGGRTISTVTVANNAFSGVQQDWTTVNNSLKFGVLKSSGGSQYEVQIIVGSNSDTAATLYYAQNERN